MQKLSEVEVNLKLQDLDSWVLKEGAIQRAFEFSDFKEALAFINKVGERAEAANHHPELLNIYNKVTIRLWTHDIGGITEKDFALAHQISSL